MIALTCYLVLFLFVTTVKCFILQVNHFDVFKSIKLFPDLTDYLMLLKPRYYHLLLAIPVAGSFYVIYCF